MPFVRMATPIVEEKVMITDVERLTDKHPSIIELERLRKQGHGSCFACAHPEMRLDFALEGPNVLRAAYDFRKSMTSFNGYVHGGLLALLLDQAMTCSLMARGVFGVTGDLNIRYRRSVEVGPSVIIRSWVEQHYHELYYLRAEVRQNDFVCTQGSARFMEKELVSHVG